MRLFFFAALLTLATLSSEAKTYSYFSPPKGWDAASPEIAATHVKVGFIGPNKKGFSPSVNLATEDVGDITLEGYIKAVKAIYERNPQNRWRQLGKIRTQAGDSSLTEIDSKTEWGDIRLMQMIFLKDKVAYIVTAAALKEEFGGYTRDFQRAFQSFTITDDLFGQIPGTERQEALKQAFEGVRKALAAASIEDKDFQKEHWTPFEKKVAAEYTDMGQLWQILLFQETLEK